MVHKDVVLEAKEVTFIMSLSHHVAADEALVNFI